MTTQHTLGPWIQSHRQGADRLYRTEVYSEEHGGIATCNWTVKHCGKGVTETYREANARLIAAAPDLIAALIAARQKLAWFVESYPQDLAVPESEFFQDIEAAIAKALGADT